jgi:uncharacterized protein YjbJ (UPF0337 family)
MTQHEHENADILNDRWQRLRHKVQRRWPKLTQQDVDSIQGNGELAIARIRERYGMAQDVAEKEWAEFSTTSGS